MATMVPYKYKWAFVRSEYYARCPTTKSVFGGGVDSSGITVPRRDERARPTRCETPGLTRANGDYFPPPPFLYAPGMCWHHQPQCVPSFTDSPVVVWTALEGCKGCKGCNLLNRMPCSSEPQYAGSRGPRSNSTAWSCAVIPLLRLLHWAVLPVPDDRSVQRPRTSRGSTSIDTGTRQ